MLPVKELTIISNNPSSDFTARFRDLMDNTVNNGRITQSQIADYIGISRQAISQYYTGVSIPSFETLLKIADFFKVTTDYLLGRSDTSVVRIYTTPKLSDRTMHTLYSMTEEEIEIIDSLICSRFFKDLLTAIQENIKLTQAEINHIESILNKEIAFDDSVYTLTDSFLYSELIDRYPFLKNRIHLAIGESAIIKQREEINEAFSKIIEQITHWNKLQNRKKELRRTQRGQEKSIL